MEEEYEFEFERILAENKKAYDEKIQKYKMEFIVFYKMFVLNSDILDRIEEEETFERFIKVYSKEIKSIGKNKYNIKIIQNFIRNTLKECFIDKTTPAWKPKNKNI